MDVFLGDCCGRKYADVSVPSDAGLQAVDIPSCGHSDGTLFLGKQG